MKKAFGIKEEVVLGNPKVKRMNLALEKLLCEHIDNHLLLIGYNKKQKSIFFNEAILLFSSFLTRSLKEMRLRNNPEDGLSVEQDFVLSHFNVLAPVNESSQFKSTVVSLSVNSTSVLEKWNNFFKGVNYKYRNFNTHFITLAINFKINVDNGDILFEK